MRFVALATSNFTVILGALISLKEIQLDITAEEYTPVWNFSTLLSSKFNGRNLLR
jgi:hypothetical protein